MNKDYYSVEEIAELLHIGKRKVLEYIKTKRLGACKVGKAYIITSEDLKKFVESCRV